jgi:hypothetical protein
MTQPAKRIPTWLTIDVLVIVISGLLPRHEPEPDPTARPPEPDHFDPPVAGGLLT